ncbi:MAG TPA: hypothetical protein VF288_00650 [Mycobacteriales bacterium]
MTAADGWCPVCLAAPAAGDDVVRRQAPAAAPLTAQVGHRAGRSQTTFGPVGRALWTIGILLVPVPFLVLSEGLAGWGLAALWWGVVTPWSLRDLWRSGRRRKRL